MIKIENLTKLYMAKKEITCRALDNVSTILPDKGLVFILGKSGSGKSTLLNLIGGLDSFDSGDIVSFGNSLSSFTEADYEAYRSDFVSFVFQDYHLIDELTVLENITLFNSDNVDEELLRETLEIVGMTDYINRYPDELSGGQKQRVAIARGVIKNPHVILCDEPTGNLDKNTSYQILELLKKLSRDKLIVIVSHNLTEAETYADRIIELADGKIIRDTERDENYCDGFSIEDGLATIPYHTRMNSEEVDRLNTAIKNGEVTEVKVNTSGFEPADIEYVEDKKELKLRLLGRANIWRLFKKFFFSKYKIAVSTIILSFLMFGLFSIIQAFTNFDPNVALIDALDEDRSIVAIERDYPSFPYNMYEELDAFKDEDTYKLYSQTIWLDSSRGSSWDNVSRLPDKTNLETLYAHENYGLLLCDDEYLIDIFGQNGEIVLLAGDLESSRTGSGILITDYFADSIIQHEIAEKKTQYLTYQSIVEADAFCPAGQNTACRISGIIDTNYKEKHKAIFDKYEQLLNSGKDGADAFDSYIANSTNYIKFADDVVLNLAVAYSLNPNYIDSFTLAETSVVRCSGLYFSAGKNLVSGKKLTCMSMVTTGVQTSDFADNEIAIPYDMYNSLYGTNYTAADTNLMDHIEKQTVTVIRYVDDDPKNDIVYTLDFTITALTTSRLVGNENTMMTIKKLDWYPSGIYIKDIKDVDNAVDFVDKSEYHFVSRAQKNVQRINELIFTFRNLFLLLEITTIVMTAFFLILFGIRSIKQNSYQIGVIKALGGRNIDVQKIFVIKTFIIGVLIAIVSSATSVFFIGAADKVLIASIETVLHMNVDGFEVIKFIPKLIIFDGILMIFLSFISSLIPAILLKRIKPVEIIKAKE